MLMKCSGSKMTDRTHLRSCVFDTDKSTFTKVAVDLFHYQYQHNPVYREYCSLLKTDTSAVTSIEQIPFLPIDFFKTHRVVTGTLPVQKIFSSSGTTGQQISRHHVCDLPLYNESFSKCFNMFLGPPEDSCLLALLPSYLEREGSSLVYMVRQLIEKSGAPESGFYRYNLNDLYRQLLQLEENQKQTILLGVTFGLLEFIAAYHITLRHTRVIETGGMKGRGEELTRESLHHKLSTALGTERIYSEYGMTELLSQAYMLDDRKFHTPPWMKVVIRDVNDPLQLIGHGKTGAINIIDLANIDSCCFIATADLGKSFPDNTFETLGRMDDSDVRGCNLMWEA